MTMHDKDLATKIGRSDNPSLANTVLNLKKNQLGFSDSGTKMIDLMGTIFEESV